MIVRMRPSFTRLFYHSAGVVHFFLVRSSAIRFHQSCSLAFSLDLLRRLKVWPSKSSFAVEAENCLQRRDLGSGGSMHHESHVSDPTMVDEELIQQKSKLPPPPPSLHFLSSIGKSIATCVLFDLI